MVEIVTVLVTQVFTRFLRHGFFGQKGFGDFHNSANDIFKRQLPNCVLASINQTKSIDA